jgi:hypothetical protein
MMGIFSKELEFAKDMYQVQSGVLRVLKEQNPALNYLIGEIDLKNFSPDNRLGVYTKLVRRFVPVFSDYDVFNQALVDRLQSYNHLRGEELLEYRRALVALGNIDTVIFLPGWASKSDIADVYFTSQSVGKNIYSLETPYHQWLRL